MAGALEGCFSSAERQPLACTNEETLPYQQGLGDFVVYQRGCPVRLAGLPTGQSRVDGRLHRQSESNGESS